MARTQGDHNSKSVQPIDGSNMMMLVKSSHQRGWARYGSLAEAEARFRFFRSSPDSRHRSSGPARPLANSTSAPWHGLRAASAYGRLDEAASGRAMARARSSSGRAANMKG